MKKFSNGVLYDQTSDSVYFNYTGNLSSTSTSDTIYGRFMDNTLSNVSEDYYIYIPVNLPYNESTIYFYYNYASLNSDGSVYVAKSSGSYSGWSIDSVTAVYYDGTEEVLTTADVDYSTSYMTAVISCHKPVQELIINIPYSRPAGTCSWAFGILDISVFDYVDPNLPSTDQSLAIMNELLSFGVYPQSDSILTYFEVVQNAGSSAVDNIKNDYTKYQSVYSSYSSGSISLDQAKDQQKHIFSDALNTASSNNDVYEAELAYYQYQTQQNDLEKLALKKVSDKYGDIISSEDRDTVDKAMQYEKDILAQFDYEAFEAQIQYDSYYQKISNSAMLSLKSIYEKILDSNIGQNFVIVPLTFGIISVLIGGIAVSSKISGDGDSDG